MGGVYVDTSALGRVLLGEPDASAVGRVLLDAPLLASSQLLRVELKRLARRRGVDMQAAESLLSLIAIVPLSEQTAAQAEDIAPDTVTTLDAVHLACAVALARGGHVDSILTFDRDLAVGGRHHGLAILAPEPLP